MKLLIDNQDGQGLVDYSAFVEVEGPPVVTRKLNRPAEMIATLATAEAGFRVPVSGARVVLQRNDGYKLFTGYLTSAPEKKYLGIAQSGTVWRFGLKALDDGWLLAHNAPSERLAFAQRTAGDALRVITADVLPGVLDVSGVQDLGTVNDYAASSQRAWSEHAQELATRERACYRVHDGKLTFQPVGQSGFVIDERDSRFDAGGLVLSQPDRVINDATIVGEVEPTTYVRDYFIGDATTLGFYLSRSPFARTTQTILEEEYSGNALNPTVWYVTDPNGRVALSAGQLNLSGGPATAGLVEQLELAGGLRLQHGQVTFSSASSGTLGGIYNGGMSDAACVAGFRVTPNGGNCNIQPLINGTPTDGVLTTQAGHLYALATQLFVNEAHRVHQTYCSSMHGGGAGRGGDSIAATMRVVLSVHDVDPGNPGTLALPATVLYDNVVAAPGFVTYALANGADLHAQVAYTRLQQMADVEVRSMIPGQSFRTRIPAALADGGECYVSSASELHFYPPYPPQTNEQIVVSYRASARAIARVQDSNSITSHNVGADRGRRSVVKHLRVPPTPTSQDCELAALALLDDSVQASWEGEYRVASECLPSTDVLPGDNVTVNAPSRGASFSAIVREVRVEVVSLAYERANFAIRFANDAAEPLAYEVSKTTIPGPLPSPYTSTSGSSGTFLPSLTAVQVTDIIATEITLDAGTEPPPGGGFEVRRSDGGWGASGDGNLVGRYTTRSFVLPRLSRIQEYAVRQYDGTNPPKYSRHSALVHVNYPW